MFFKSLAAQFDQVQNDNQPGLMLELQKLSTNAMMPIPVSVPQYHTAFVQPQQQQQANTIGAAATTHQPTMICKPTRRRLVTEIFFNTRYLYLFITLVTYVTHSLHSHIT